jgi:FHS family L-fucose permease-like MFS transporter
MAIEHTSQLVGESPPADRTGAPLAYSSSLKLFVFALFFAFGGITSLNDILVPKLKSLFTLSYADGMLVQSAFFAAYFVVSLPAAALVRRIGYLRAAAVGLLTMTAGCLLFVPASSFGVFGLFLLALFVLAAGITTVQVVSNPLISMLGPPGTASSRLTFAQAFNSLGTTIFPFFGSILILGSLAAESSTGAPNVISSQFRSAETRVIVHTYFGLAVALCVLAAAVWMQRGSLSEAPRTNTPILRALGLLRQPRFALGALCIFLYVGGEVSIGSLIVNYLIQPDVFGGAARQAGEHVPYYWGGAMVGRFIGAYVLRIVSPGKVLATVAAVVILLLIISANSNGFISGWSLLAIGLFNSIMFPTIFSLASEGLGPRAAEGSGVIGMAIVGGAIVPLLTGLAADSWGLKLALAVPAVCYVGILLYGWFARRPMNVAVVSTRLGST